LPSAKQPNLLPKDNGRVNRILGPEEDLSDALTDRQLEANEKAKGAAMPSTHA